jgi:hypothetical protein
MKELSGTEKQVAEKQVEEKQVKRSKWKRSKWKRRKWKRSKWEEKQEETQLLSQEEFNLSLFQQLNGDISNLCWNWVRGYITNKYNGINEMSYKHFEGDLLLIPNKGHNHILVYYWEYDHMVVYPNYTLSWLKKICVHVKAMYTENIPHFTNHGFEIGCVRACFVKDGVLTSRPLRNATELKAGEILLLIVAPPFDPPPLAKLISMDLVPETLELVPEPSESE